MRRSARWWLTLLVCAAVFWAGLVCLLTRLDAGGADPVALAVRDLTVAPAAAPEDGGDWRDWYEVRYTLENQSDRSLDLDDYNFSYKAGSDTLYPWEEGSDAVLAARPVLPAGRTVEVRHLLCVEEGQTARVKLRYDSWDARSDVLLEFELGE